MATIYETLEDYDLIGRLKSINATLRQSDRSVIERYAGIAELALYKDIRKVGVITVGLVDTNPQVRSLAATTLNSYGLSETAQALLSLLDNGGQELKDALTYHDQERFVALLKSVEKLVRKPRAPIIDGDVIDYDRRHILVILQGLGRELRRLQTQGYGTGGIHPLKQMLEEKDNRWILSCILDALDKSKDIYCRRQAIGVIGELGLDFGFDKPAFELICEAMEREENRGDYLVTWDGLKALTALIQQNASAEQVEAFHALLRGFFKLRTYQNVDYEAGIEQSYYTRLHCIEAVSETGNYELLAQIVEDGERGGFLRMMNVTRVGRDVDSSPRLKGAIARVKKAVIDAFLRMYLSETLSDEMTGRQREILDKVSMWISSQDRRVPEWAISFFSNLPNAREALRYLLESAKASNARIDVIIAPPQEGVAKIDKNMQQALDNLLEDRKEFIIVLGTIFARNTQDDQTIAPIRQEVIGLLRIWCLQRFPQPDSKSAKNARLEALWAFYDLTRDMPYQEQLNPEDIKTLLSNEDTLSLRVILELLHARTSDTPFAEQLKQIANNKKEARLVSVCAEIEEIILTKGKRTDLSDEALEFLPGKLGHANEVHIRLAQRFMPVLAQMEQPNAVALVASLLKKNRYRALPASLLILLRESLSEYQCYQHHDDLLDMLLQNLSLRYIDPLQLHLNYLNLLNAGKYYQRNIKEQSRESDERFWEVEGLAPIQQHVLGALQDISKEFDEIELPILFKQENERVVALENATSAHINMVLYAVEEDKERKNSIKGYLRSRDFANKWVFLNTAMTDSEISHVIYGTVSGLSDKFTRVSPQRKVSSEIQKGIVGRVTDVCDDGVSVNVGLLHYQPFVAKANFVSESNPVEEWQSYARNLQGTEHVFSIKSITFDLSSGVDEIEHIELVWRPSKEDMLAEMLRGVADNTVQAQVKLLDSEHKQVIFHTEGKLIAVPHQELSWRNTKTWMDGEWQKHFEGKIGKTYEVVHNGNSWTMRENTPHFKYFAQLFYEQGTTEFELIYVRRAEMGYVFEIEPGHFCYVPADRLLDRQVAALQEESQPKFLLPSSNIGPGDLLKVCYQVDEIDGKAEVVLNVVDILENPLTNDRLRKGMKISGQLFDLDLNKRMGKLSSTDPALKDFTFRISNLPVDDPSVEIEEGIVLNGRIENIDGYAYTIALTYAVAMPGDLKEGQVYPCQVMYDPMPGDYRLKLRYANVIGEVREADMTYRHTPVLPNYHRGDPVMACLSHMRRDRSLDKNIQPKRYEQILSAIDLQVQTVTMGDIIQIQRRSNQVTVEREDGTVFTFALGDLELGGDERHIREGNHIQFTRDARGNLNVKVSSAYAIFTLLPRLDKSDGWHKFDQIAPATLAQLFPPGKARECVYVTRQGKYYLLEIEPGVLIALPHTYRYMENPVVAESSQWYLKSQQDQLSVEEVYPDNYGSLRYKVATGDILTLMRYQEGEALRLQGFQLGPLHLAAEPWLVEETQEDFITVIGTILPSQTARENGASIEIVRLENREIKMRNGLRSFYSTYKMTPQDKQRFEEGRLSPRDEVRLMLDAPPTIKDGRLWLAVRGLAQDGPRPVITATFQPLQDPAPYIASLQPGTVVNGVIKKYDKKELAFEVNLDELANADPQLYACWLSGDLVSYSMVSSYLSSEAFAGAGTQLFTVVAVDLEEATIEVSLKDNPRMEIDDAGVILDWSDGQLLKHTTFLGLHTRKISKNQGEVLPQEQPEALVESSQFADEGEGGDESVKEGGVASPVLAEDKEEVVGIEITPGVFVNIPSNRLFIDSIPYSAHEKYLQLQVGAQMTLRVLENNGHFELVVTHSQLAEINLLSNPRRVFYGRLGALEEGKYALKLEGYSRTLCYLERDAATDSEIEKLASYDLFRFKRRDPDSNELYFQPVQRSNLKKGDLLRIRYQRATSDWSDRALVTYGNQHLGYIRQSDISYRSNFNLKDFNPEQDKREFEARILEVNLKTQVVFFSIKDAFIQRLSYFQNSHVQSKFSTIFSTVLVHHFPQKDYIDIEVEPGTIVRVPYRRIIISSGVQLSAQELRTHLMVGDTLQFKLLLRQHKEVYLQLVGVVKSLLHYLQPDMLVNAHFDQRGAVSGGPWIFSLPDFEDRQGEIAFRSGTDFYSDVFNPDLQLVVEKIPVDPSTPLTLRQRTRMDEQQVVRVEYVGADQISVQKEDGRNALIFSRRATYRVDNRVSYLKQTLQPGDIITVTRTTTNKGEIIFSLLENKAAPFAFLLKYMRRKQKQTFDLTYVRSEGEDHIFELEPSYLITIPTVSLYFYDGPFHTMQRFLPGDVFHVRVEHDQDELRVIVQSLSLSVFHFWQPDQYILAEVVETYPISKGIMVKAGPLEEFIPEIKLLPGHTANTFTTGSTLWMKVEWIQRKLRDIGLKEVAISSLNDILNLQQGDRRRDPILYGKIVPSRSQANRSLEIEILDRKIIIGVKDIAWQDATFVDEVLPADEVGLWVQLSVSRNGFFVNPKSPQSFQVMQQFKAGDIVQAYVEKLNQDQRGNVTSALLNVDEVRTLIPVKDLVWGAPLNKTCVEEGTWLLVRIQDTEYNNYSGKGLFEVSTRAVSNALVEIPAGSPFTSTVRYTLSHGLVFSYQGALGYVSNQDLTWSREVSAYDIFAPGDMLTVYKIAQRFSQTAFTFSLKYPTQIEGLKVGEIVNASVYRQVDKGIYLQTADLPVNFQVFITHYHPDFAYLKTVAIHENVILRLADLDMQHKVISFHLQQAHVIDSNSASKAKEGETNAILENAYMTSVNRFLQLLRQNNVIDLLKQQSPGSGELPVEQHFVKLLNDCQIACTYRNLRVLLGKLGELYVLQPLWKRLEHYQLEKNVDDSIVFVLCQVAQELSRRTQETDPASYKLQHYPSYVLGILPLLSDAPDDLTYAQALEYLLIAYRQDKAIDSAMALLLIYEELQMYSLRQKFVETLVLDFSQNISRLLKLPEPLLIPETSYNNLKNNVPGLNMKLDRFATDVRRLLDDNLLTGKIERTEIRLQAYLNQIGKEVSIPELQFNLALCATLRSDFEQALRWLEQVKACLTRGEERSRFAGIRQAYYQLGMYVYYHQKNFKQLQTFIARGVLDDFESWQHTWVIGYLLLGTGNLKVSKEISLGKEIPVRSASPEQILLVLYWQNDGRSHPKSFKTVKLLREVLFQKLYQYTHTWEESELTLRIIPNPQRSEMKDIVQNARQYDAPDYALQRYKENPTQAIWMGNESVANGLVDLTLRKTRIKEAETFAKQYFYERNNRSYSLENARFIAKFYRSLLLLKDFERFMQSNPRVRWTEIPESRIQNLTKTALPVSSNVPDTANAPDYLGYAAQMVVERWIKSPYGQQHLGRNLAQLFAESPMLQEHYWQQPELRKYLWHVFSLCNDYGTLIKMLPKHLPLEALEDTVFHLYSLKLPRHARALIQRTAETTLVDATEQEKWYTIQLEFLGEEAYTSAFEQTLHYLLACTSKRALVFYTDKTERQAAIRALTLLVQYPEESRQGKMLLLLGELQEIEQHYAEAGATYLEVVTELSHLPAIKRLQAAICLLRLHLRVPTAVSWPQDLALNITQENNEITYLGDLLGDLETLAAKLPNAQERSQFILMLGRLQIVLETVSNKDRAAQLRRQEFLTELDALLYSLYQLSGSGTCLISLYQTLVGTKPLRGWSPGEIGQMLSLFVDFGLATRYSSDLEEFIELTMDTTISHFKNKARSGLKEDTTNLAAVIEVKEHLLYLEEWVVFYRLTDSPQLIENKASVVRKFLLERERLASLWFDKGTQSLIDKYGDNKPYYGSATHWLIARAMVRKGDRQGAMKEVYNENNLDERNKLLLMLFFDCLQHDDRSLLPSIEKQITGAFQTKLERFMQRREASQMLAKDAQTFVLDVCNDLDFLCEHGQFKLACEYLLGSYAKVGNLWHGVWGKFLAYYGSHYVNRDDCELTNLFVTIASYDLQGNTDAYLQQRVLRELGQIETRKSVEVSSHYAESLS